jgi:hypothetical protein
MEERSMKALITAALIFMALGWYSAPVRAQASFTAEKICGMSQPPNGFKKLNVFARTAQYYRPLFDANILISNINNDCWLKINFEAGFITIEQIFSQGSGRRIYVGLESRKLAEEKFLDLIDECGKGDEEYVNRLYYSMRFRRDFPISTQLDGESLCFQAMTYGTEALLITSTESKVVIDIVEGMAFLGEVK